MADNARIWKQANYQTINISIYKLHVTIGSNWIREREKFSFRREYKIFVISSLIRVILSFSIQCSCCYELLLSLWLIPCQIQYWHFKKNSLQSMFCYQFRQKRPRHRSLILKRGRTATVTIASCGFFLSKYIHKSQFVLHDRNTNFIAFFKLASFTISWITFKSNIHCNIPLLVSLLKQIWQK